MGVLLNTSITLLQWTFVVGAIIYTILYFRCYGDTQDFDVKTRLNIALYDLFLKFTTPFASTEYEHVINSKQRVNKLLLESSKMRSASYPQDIVKILDFHVPFSHEIETANLAAKLTELLKNKDDGTPISVNDEEGGIFLRYYEPKNMKPNSPAIMFIHGGGWVFGTVMTYDKVCRAIAAKSNFPVFNVEYRTAPEHKFPTAPNDVYAAAKWIYKHANLFSIDKSKLVVMGDSAGGNLAAVVTLMGAVNNEQLFAYQYLIYPATDYINYEYPSQSIMGKKSYLLNDEMMVWFWDVYIEDKHDRVNWKAAPMKFSDQEVLKQLPPASVTLCTYDPLHDEGVAYAEKLSNAGVAVRQTEYRTFHGFLYDLDSSPKSAALFAEIVSTLQSHFNV